MNEIPFSEQKSIILFFQKFMPRGKRPAFRRRRRTFKRKFKSKVQAIVTRTLRRSEPLRYVDEYSATQTLTTAATFTKLTDAIAQGPGVGDREGDRINVRSIQGRFLFHRKETATQGLCACRVILFKWFPDTSADPPNAGTDIIYDQTNHAVGSPITMVKINRRKFAVIKDWTFNLAVPGDSGSVKIFNFNWRPKGRMGIVDYSLAGGAEAKGHFYIMTISNQQADSTQEAEMRYHTVISFDP